MATTAAALQSTANPPGSSHDTQRRKRPRHRNRNKVKQQEGGAAEQATHELGRGGQREGTQSPAPSTSTTFRLTPPSVQAATRRIPDRESRRHERARSHLERFPQRPAAGDRQFCSQLTEEKDAAIESRPQISTPGLSAGTPTFEAGHLVAPRKPPVSQVKTAPALKQTVVDIPTRIHDDIDNGRYECAICTESVNRYSKGVWSCWTCWAVFHLGCIKKWSTNECSAASQQQVPGREMPLPRQWRCPGCNLPKDTLPKAFHCWCEKEPEPKCLPGLPPFSCGQSCSRPRTLPKKCPHPCDSTCHAGPCPPCSLKGPTQLCFCGKKLATRRCVDTDYEHGWSCGEICGATMSCGEHQCLKQCHEGPCGPCEMQILARCYCGQVQKNTLCHGRAKKTSSRAHMLAGGSLVVEEWTGTFQCLNQCSRPFDCGKHKCKISCHQQDTTTLHCPRSPDVVSRCPCGKTRLSDMPHAARATCEDPIPTCDEPCGQLLVCGHRCQQSCHQGECHPCLERITISCCCRRTTSETICHQGLVETPQCMRICRVSLNCGRHECRERCCVGEKKAAERQSNRRKARPLHSAPRRPDDTTKAEHICTRACDRPLKCGIPEHRCQELCHKGVCGSCRDAIFDELSCHCGRTVLQPPIPCGTKPPSCRYPCERPKECGHPQLDHNCHINDQDCPKCAYLTTKTCLCRKSILKNLPCWLNEARCGKICGRTLKCGVHRCQKQCHRLGECHDPCTQLCGKKLSICGHPCKRPCHLPEPCKEENPCSHTLVITCECQRIKQEANCNASRNGGNNFKKGLECDEECARLERNRKLALALDIDPGYQDNHVPYSDATLNRYQENSTWAATQEKNLRLFAADTEEIRLRFKPMNPNQRAFIHSLAKDFGLYSESMDPEPHRHVAIFKTPRFVMAPTRTLADCARTRQMQQRTVPTLAPITRSAATLRPNPRNILAYPYNAFLILDPRFALTVEEVDAVLKSVLLNTFCKLELEVNFLSSEAVSLKPSLRACLDIPDRVLQTMLESIRKPLSQALIAQNIGRNLRLARLDSSLNVQRRESDIGIGSCWSLVASSKSIPLCQPPQSAPFGNKGSFAVFSLSSMRKKKEKPDEVVEDWEAAEAEEEQKENMSVSSGVVPR